MMPQTVFVHSVVVTKEYLYSKFTIYVLTLTQTQLYSCLLQFYFCGHDHSNPIRSCNAA